MKTLLAVALLACVLMAGLLLAVGPAHIDVSDLSANAALRR